MASTVFFSFHYDEDWTRMWNIRKSDQFKNNLEDSGTFKSRAVWESVRLKTNRAIQDWIDEGLKYSGVTVVLISGETYKRDWVRYEIAETDRQRKGMFGVYVHGLKDMRTEQYGVKGPNPFDYVSTRKSYRTYDWVNDFGKYNFNSWVQQAALDARYG